MRGLSRTVLAAALLFSASSASSACLEEWTWYKQDGHLWIEGVIRGSSKCEGWVADRNSVYGTGVIHIGLYRVEKTHTSASTWEA